MHVRLVEGLFHRVRDTPRDLQGSGGPERDSFRVQVTNFDLAGVCCLQMCTPPNNSALTSKKKRRSCKIKQKTPH
jgi:hypothetical protein